MTYNSVIFAWSRSSQPESGSKAESLLNEMLSLAEAGDKKIAPDVGCYNQVLSAIATGGLPCDVQGAERIIKRMEENRISPNQYARKTMRNLTKGKSISYFTLDFT